MEPQLGLYAILGEMLGLGYPTIGIKARLGPVVVWMVFPRLDPYSTVLVDPGKPCTERKPVKGRVFPWLGPVVVWMVFPRLDPGSTVLVDPGKPCTERKPVKGGVFR
ncbi:hypothetical protein Tco_0565029, partial [Tanacetum coccineum]